MALIYFYDATDIDKQQLTDGLLSTDHHWEYVEDKISLENLHPDTEVLSVFVSSTVTREIIEKLPRLRLIACRSTGFNNVDMRAAEEHDVIVTNVPSYGEQTVAEYTFALMLSLSRKLPETLVTDIRAQKPVAQLRGFDLAGKTIGIVGTGHIGKKVASIAHGFGMNILAYDPYPNDETAKQFHLSYVTLEELLKQSDAVTLHVPYMKSTHHLINAERIALMKPSSVLVNTARGELVDTEALVIALTSEQIAGAGLDVLEGEGLWHLDDNVALLQTNSATHADAQHSLEQLALSKLPNVILTPHNAFNTAEAIGRINATVCENITRFWYGETPNKVTLDKKETGKLIIVRHAESEWNATGKWTGKTDVHLSEKGFKQAAAYGRLLAQLDIAVDYAYCSEQVRSLETLEAMLDSAGQFDVEHERSAAVNERDYGDYTGKNKWEVRQELGDEEFTKLRRGWDYPVPNGETLKTVYERVVPFYKETILPRLLKGDDLLLVAHGNSLRALAKYIEKLSDNEVGELEMLLGQIVTYEIDERGEMISKRVDQIDVGPTSA